MKDLVFEVSRLLKRPGSQERVSVETSLDEVEKGGEEVQVEGPVRMNAVLREAGGKILAEGEIQAEIMLVCGRCLKKFGLSVSQSFSELYRRHGDFNREDPDEREDEEFLAIEEGKVDLEPVLRQSLVLAVPFAPICRESCRGLCPVCGEAAEDGKHEHNGDEEELTGYKAVLSEYLADHKEDEST